MSTAPPDLEPVRCPICRASQPWSDTCRRCKGDLRLLRESAKSYQKHRLDCLRALELGRPREALEAARRCLELIPCEESQRLVAIAGLRAGDWAAAASIASKVGTKDSSVPKVRGT